MTASLFLTGVGPAFARNAFLNMLAYRVRYVVGVLNYLLYVSVHYYLMKAVMLSKPGVSGVIQSEGDLVTYYAVGWTARAAYFNNIDSKIAEQVKSGEIAMELIRPASYPVIRYFESFGETLFRFLFMSLPIFIFLFFIYRGLMNGPIDSLGFLYFSLSLVMSFHIYFAINFLTGLAAVLFLNIQGFMWAKFLMLQVLSGIIVPFSFLGERAEWFLSKTPFAGLGHTPVLLYLGKLSGESALEALGWQAFWTVVLLWISMWAWKAVVHKVSIQGG